MRTHLIHTTPASPLDADPDTGTAANDAAFAAELPAAARALKSVAAIAPLEAEVCVGEADRYYLGGYAGI